MHFAGLSLWIQILFKFFLFLPATTTETGCNDEIGNLFSHFLVDAISQVFLNGEVMLVYDKRDEMKIIGVLTHLYRNAVSVITQEIVLIKSSDKYLDSFEKFYKTLEHASADPRKITYIIPFCITPAVLNDFLARTNEKHCHDQNGCIRGNEFKFKKSSDIIIWGCNNYFDSSKSRRILGKWSKSAGFKKPIPVGLIDKAPTKQLLQGKTIKAGILQGIPFIKYSISENNELTKIDGIEFEMIQAYANYYQFRTQFTKPDDNQWGKEINGSWSGLIGMIQRKEVDIAFNSLSQTYWRMKAVDFTFVHFTDRIVYATTAPKRRADVSLLLYPFHKNVFYAIIVSSFGIALFTHFFKKCRKNDRAWNFGHTVFFLLTALTFRSEALPSPKSMSLRIMIGVWWLSVLVIMSAFSSELTSILNVPPKDSSLNTLEDLTQAIENKEVLPMVVEGTSSSKSFQSAKSGYFKTIGDSLEVSPVLKVKNASVGLKMVGLAPVAFVYPKALLEGEAIAQGQGNFHISEESLFLTHYAMAVPVGSPLKKLFDPIGRRLQESGLIEAWNQRALQMHNMKHHHLLEDDVPQKHKTRITLKQMFPVLFFLTIGYTISVSALAVEIIISKWHRFVNSRYLLK